MIYDLVMTYKRLLHGLVIGFFAVVGLVSTCTLPMAKQIVTNTARAVQDFRAPYVQSVKDVEAKFNLGFFFGQGGFEAAAKVMGYGKKEVENAKIARRFFDTGKAVPIARTIGTTQADLDYIANVFSEFFAHGPHTFDRLVAIMHHYTMQGLGLDLSTTIPQFLKIMEATNKQGRYRYIQGVQFEAYKRLIALNLFVKYWFEAHIKNKSF